MAILFFSGTKFGIAQEWQMLKLSNFETFSLSTLKNINFDPERKYMQKND